MCSEVLRTWEADEGEMYPKGSLARSEQDKAPRIAEGMGFKSLGSSHIYMYSTYLIAVNVIWYLC